MEKIVDLIARGYPEWIMVLIVGIVVWFVAKLYFKRFLPMEDKVNNAPCNKDKDFYKDMAKSMRKIEKYMIKETSLASVEVIKRCCPYKLTDIGNKLLNISGSKKCIDDNIDFFDSEIQKFKPQVALDVEDYSLTVLNENTDKSFFNPIKDFVFHASYPYVLIDDEGNREEFKEDINMNTMLTIMSVYLRDKYFERHPEYLDKSNNEIE